MKILFKFFFDFSTRYFLDLHYNFRCNILYTRREKVVRLIWKCYIVYYCVQITLDKLNACFLEKLAKFKNI